MVKPSNRAKSTKRTPKGQGQKLDRLVVRTIQRTRGMTKAIAATLGTSEAYVSMVVNGKKNATERFVTVAQELLYKDARDRDLAIVLARYPRPESQQTETP